MTPVRRPIAAAARASLSRIDALAPSSDGAQFAIAGGGAVQLFRRGSPRR